MGPRMAMAAPRSRGQALARQHQSMDCVVLRCELPDREILMQSAPDAFFITDHYRNYPWILCARRGSTRRVLPELIERAWRLVASKTLIKKHALKPRSDD